MSGQVTIVMYHYIRDFAQARYPGIRGLHFAGFLRQLDHLQSHFRIVRIEDVVAALRGHQPLPPRAALLTFDDGYAEHYDLVFPELFDRGLQGCFYPPVAPIRDGVLLDVNRIHFILAATLDDPTKVSSHIDRAIREADPSLGLRRVEAYRAEWAQPNRFDNAETIYIKRMLQTVLPDDMRNRLADELFTRFVSADEAAFAGELYITTAQARLMQSCGMMFGSHGASHYWLNHIPRNVQEREVDISLEFLREIGTPIDDHWVMSYPFGGWNEELLDVLRNRNCTLGLTTDVATADLARHDPLCLPRYDTNDFPR